MYGTPLSKHIKESMSLLRGGSMSESQKEPTYSPELKLKEVKMYFEELSQEH